MMYSDWELYVTAVRGIQKIKEHHKREASNPSRLVYRSTELLKRLEKMKHRLEERHGWDEKGVNDDPNSKDAA